MAKQKLPERVIVAADEAYFEYMDDPARVDSLAYQESGRVIVTLRTFSKCYGLAGLRIGYAVGHPRLVDYLNRVRQPFNTNLLAQIGALGALVMWMFVHMYIWPNIQVVLGLRHGDANAKLQARARVVTFAGLNLVLAVPVTLAMVAAAHLY